MPSFQEELRALFDLHHFTPTTPADSESVRAAVEECFVRARVALAEGQIDILQGEGEGGGAVRRSGPMLPPSQFEFTALDILKYVAKKHGLPRSFLAHLLPRLPDPLANRRQRLQMAQILRYALEHDMDFTTLADCISLVLAFTEEGTSRAETGDAGAGDVQAAEEAEEYILPEVGQCVLLKLRAGTGCEFTEGLHSKLQRLAPHFGRRTQTELGKILEAWAARDNNKRQTGGDLLQDDILSVLKSDKLKKGRGETGGSAATAVFGFGGQAFQQGLGGGLSAATPQPQAHAVKTQQVVATSVKHNKSEKSELEAISLSAALAQGRNAAKNVQTEATLEPLLSTKGGSDRSWWKPTGWEIGNFLRMADAKEPLKADDIVWLKEKTNFGVNLTNTLVGVPEMNGIARIFAAISAFQDLDGDIVTALAENLFGRRLGKSYDNCRLNLLKAFENFSRRRPAIPDRMQATLCGFKEAPDCSTEMRRFIWKIMMKDDGNLEETFEESLSQLEPAAGAAWVATCASSLDYIASHVVIEQRAVDLEGKFKFSATLLEIVANRDGKYPARMRRQAAEIVESLVAHASHPGGLDAQWLEAYEELYGGGHAFTPISLQAASAGYDVSDVVKVVTKATALTVGTILTAGSLPALWMAGSMILTGRIGYDYGPGDTGPPVQVAEEESWPPDEERQQFRAAVIRTILHTMDKGAGSGSKDARANPPSEALLRFLVKLTTLDEDPRLEAYIVITLGNLVVRGQGKIRIPDPERLAHRLARADAVDRQGLVYLGTEEEESPSEEQQGESGGGGKRKGSGAGGVRGLIAQARECALKKWQEKTAGSSAPGEATRKPAAEEGLEYLSHFVSNILLKSVPPDADGGSGASSLPAGALYDETTFEYIFEAVRDRERDKNTRITCAECLFQASAYAHQCLGLPRLDSLRHLTMDTVPDVSVFMTVVFCQQLWIHFGPGDELEAAGHSGSNSERDDDEVGSEDELEPTGHSGSDSTDESDEVGSSDESESAGHSGSKTAHEGDECGCRCGGEGVLPDEDFRWLVKLYDHDGSLLTLGERDFAKYVNTPILEVLWSQAGRVSSFPDDVFQLFTQVIRTGSLQLQEGELATSGATDSIALCIQTLLAHYTPGTVGVGGTHARTPLPVYCLQTVEILFQCLSPSAGLLHPQVLQLLRIALVEFGLHVAEATVGHVYNNFVGYETLTEATSHAFGFLLEVFLLQGLPQHMFEVVDMEFMAVRLATCLARLGEPEASPDVAHHLLKDWIPLPAPGDGLDVELLVVKTMTSFIAYGRPLSRLGFWLARRGFALDMGWEPVLRCLLSAVENEQNLPTGLVADVLSRFQTGSEAKNRDRNLAILSLTLSLVAHHQKLPSPFVELILEEFCGSQGNGVRHLGEEPIYDNIFALVVKLCEEQGATESMCSARVIGRLCDLWRNSSSSSVPGGNGPKQHLPVASDKHGKDSGEGESAAETWATPAGFPKTKFEYAAFIRLLRSVMRVKRTAGFWKRTRRNRHRLQVLSALKAVASSATGTKPQISAKEGGCTTFTLMRPIFLEAVQDPNRQIASTGLHGLLSLSPDLLQAADFNILLGVACETRPARGTSQEDRNIIQTFLHKNLERLPADLRARFKFLADVRAASSSHDRQRLLQTLEAAGDHLLALALDEGEDLQGGLAALLQQGGAVHAHARVLRLLRRLPPDSKSKMSTRLVESIAFMVAENATVTNSSSCSDDDEEASASDLKKTSKLLIVELLDAKAPLSSTFMSYLALNPDYIQFASQLQGERHVEGQGGSLEFKIGVQRFLSQCARAGVAVAGGRDGHEGVAVAQFLANMLATPIASMNLGYELFMKFLELVPLPLLQSSSAFANLLVTNCLQIQPASRTRLLSGVHVKKFADVIEKALLKQRLLLSLFLPEGGEEVRLHPSVLVAYGFMLKEGVSTRGSIPPCLRGLAQLCQECSDPAANVTEEKWVEMRMLVTTTALECFFEAAKLGPSKLATESPKNFPLEVVHVVLDLFGTPALLPRHRDLCFKVLTRLDFDAVLVAGGRGNEMLEKAKACVQQIITRSAAFGVELVKHAGGGAVAPTGAEEEQRFAKELVGCLYGLRAWDVRSLKGQPACRWRQCLVFSDFLATFATCRDEEIRLVLLLNGMYKQHGPDAMEELCRHLTHRFSTSSPGAAPPKFSTILSIMADLPLEESLHVFWKCAASPVGELVRELEDSWVVQVLQHKLQTPVGNEMLRVLQRQFTDAVGGDLTGFGFQQLLLTKLGPLADTGQYVGLVHALAAHRPSISTPATLEVKNAIVTELEEAPDGSLSAAALQALVETQILVSLCPANSKLHPAAPIQRLLLHQRIPFDVLHELLSLVKRRHVSGKPNDFDQIVGHVLSQAGKYSVTPDVFSELVGAIKSSDSVLHPPDCIRTCGDILNQFAFTGGHGGLKDVATVLGEFCALNAESGGGGQIGVDEELESLRMFVVKIQLAEVKSRMTVEGKPICEWSEREVRRWAAAVAMTNANANGGSGSETGAHAELDFEECLMVARQAVYLTCGYVLTHVQLLAIVQGLQSMHSTKGQLLQVSTGSGKSTIVAVIAALTCLKSARSVDVYTSSGVLAERDAKEWRGFYELFRLTVDHNGDRARDYVTGPKACYTKRVVYGECAQFQFDYLRDKYSALGTLAGRGCDFAIVDEVDSMFIDDGSKLARLSSTLPGMDLLHPLYHLIWDRLHFMKSHLFRVFDQMYYMEGQTQVQVQAQHTPEEPVGLQSAPTPVVSYTFADSAGELLTIANVIAYIVEGGDLKGARIHPVTTLEEFVSDHLQKYTRALISTDPVPGFSPGGPPTLKLPRWLLEYALAQIPAWVRSALTSLLYQENVHYVVDEGVVKPVDYATTGVVQSCTNWSNGLHQFLQLKHGLRLSSESVTTNFMSNTAMFKKYGPRLVGFTGTLGSEACRHVLQGVYNMNLFIIPETHHKKWLRFPDHVADSEGEWFREILVGTLEEVSKRRGVLVICQTIKDAELVTSALSHFKHVRVKSYTKNAEDQEKAIERILPGDVFVATNLAGRGTDIKASDIERYGGLHVILTFLPSSLRVEEQAFGRTSRQGKTGTGQLIIRMGVESEGEEAAGHGAAGVTVTALAGALTAERDAKEARTLEHFQANELVLIRTKDGLFDQFCELYRQVRAEVHARRLTLYGAVKDVTSALCSIAVTGQLPPAPLPPTPDEVIIMQAVEQRWAILLHEMDTVSVPADRTQAQALSRYTSLKNSVLKDLGTDSGTGVGALLRDSGRGNAFYFTQLGNYEYSMDSKYCARMEAAASHYREAIEMEPEFAAGARVGLAYALLTGERAILFADTHSAEEYKELALDQLRLAEPLLAGEMALITVTQSLLQRFGSAGPTLNSDLFKQSTEKANLLGSYLKNVQANAAVVERSLRRVTCLGVLSGVNEKKVAGERTMSRKAWNVRTFKDALMRTEERTIPWRTYESYELTFADLTCFKDGNKVQDQAVNTIKVMDTFKWKLRRQTKESFMVTCPNAADLHKVLNKLGGGGSSGVAVTDLDMNLELCNLDLEVLTGGEKLDELAGLKPSRFTLQVSSASEASRQQLLKFALSLRVAVAELKIRARVEEVVEGDGDNAEGQCRVVWEFDPEQSSLEEGVAELQNLFSDSDPDCPACSLCLLIETENVAVLGDVVAKLLEATVPELRTSLTLHTIRPPHEPEQKSGQGQENGNEGNDQTERKESPPDAVRAALSGFNAAELRLGNLSPDTACTIIRKLRDVGTDFSLTCSGLDLSAAQHLLQKADLAQETIQTSKYKELLGLYMADCLPLQELRDLGARGVCLMVTFNERQFVPWISICTVVGLAALQAGAGVVLIWTGFGATVGMGLITESMADLVLAQRIYTTRHFTWAEYGTQKAVSLAISCVSMGLSALKDGAKGATLVGQSAATEVAEQVAGNAIMSAGQKTANQVVSHAGKNLSSLAYKKLGVSLAETGGRIALKTLLDGVTDFAFDQMRDAIVENVSKEVRLHFHQEEFEALLGFYYALDPTLQDLRLRVLGVVGETLNPKASKWLSLWNSVGAPLSNGILASPQFLGSVASRATLAYGIISGVRQIATVVDKVCSEVHAQLSRQKPSVEKILQTHARLSSESARAIASQISFVPRSPECQSDFLVRALPPASEFPDASDRTSVKDLYKGLAERQAGFKARKHTGLSQLLRVVVDMLVNHIIQIGNSHLVSPISSQLVGSLVAKISAELQDRFICNAAEDGRDQPGGPRTVAGQIRANEKDMTVAWQRRAIVAKAMRDVEAGGEGAAPSPVVASVANGALNGAPANMAIMFSLATQNGLNIKIVAPDYAPTEQDKAEGVPLVVFEKGTGGGVGHYSLMDPATGGRVTVQGSGGMDCGYDVIAYLTGGAKTSAELRNDAYTEIHDSPAKFEEIQSVADWLVERHPSEANEALLVGGREEKWKDTGYPWAFNPGEEDLHAELQADDEEVKDRVEQGPTPRDGPGAVYAFEVPNGLDGDQAGGVSSSGPEAERDTGAASSGPEVEQDTGAASSGLEGERDAGVPLTKIGRTAREPPSKRPKELETKNRETYVDVGITPVATDHKTVENVAHKMLAYAHEPRERRPDGTLPAGGNETFREDRAQIDAMIKRAVVLVEAEAAPTPAQAEALRDEHDFQNLVGQVHMRYQTGDEYFPSDDLPSDAYTPFVDSEDSTETN